MPTGMIQSRVLFRTLFGQVSWSITLLYLSLEIHGSRIPIEEEMDSHNICTTPVCINEGRMIYENLNSSIDPCNNFYEFVCGGWSSVHPATISNAFARNQYWDLNHLNTARARDILETRSEAEDPEYLFKAKTFYKSCLKRDSEVDQNFQILKERLDIWGGWPIASEHWVHEKFDWRKLLVHLLRTNDLYPLLRIYVSLDYRNTTRASIMIDQADEKFCLFHESARGEKELENAIIKTARQIVNATDQSVREVTIIEDAAAIVRLEDQICKMRRRRKNRTDRIRYLTKTVRQIQKLSDDTDPINEFAQVNWLKLLNEYLQGSTVKIDENEDIIVIEPDYVFELMELIDEVPQRVLANYMLWYHVEFMGADEWLEFLDDETLFSASSTAVRITETRWKKCAQETDAYFQHAVGYEFVKLYFDEDSKQNATELVKNLLSSMVEDLQENDWMDGRTRSLAVDKAKTMKLLVGYPDWYNTSELNNHYQKLLVGSNYIINVENIKKNSHHEYLQFFDGTDKEVDYWPQLTDVNAYHYEANVIVVPAGIFQAPFYVKGRPDSLNYGSIGYIIGHELSHSFDIIGRKYDKHGSLSNWWSTEALKVHTAKKRCIEELFSAFPTPELENEKAWRLDGPGTIGENMADIGGMELAFSAYRKYHRKHRPEKKLPGLTHLSPEQLFFIGYVTANCESATSEYVSAVILADEHTPNRYSAIITVANSKDFSAAWKCKEDDKMSSTKECRFW